MKKRTQKITYYSNSPLPFTYFRVRLAVQNFQRFMSQKAAVTSTASNSTLTSFELEPDVEQLLLGL